MLDAFTDQLVLGLEARRLRHEAATVDVLAQANELRAALLRAVSHDLRTPLASIKASVSGLLEPSVSFSATPIAPRCWRTSTAPPTASTGSSATCST